MKFLTSLLAPLFLAVLLPGCASTDPATSSSAAEAKSADYKIEFDVIGDLTLQAGKPARLVFRLRNAGDERLTIPDWKIRNDENDVMNIRQDWNVLLYGQPWFRSMGKPDPEAWFEYNEISDTPPRFIPLDLLPGNQVLIEKHLDFVEALVVPADSERRYFFKAELNLTGIKAATEVFVVVVRGRK